MVVRHSESGYGTNMTCIDGHKISAHHLFRCKEPSLTFTAGFSGFLRPMIIHMNMEKGTTIYKPYKL